MLDSLRKRIVGDREEHIHHRAYDNESIGFGLASLKSKDDRPAYDPNKYSDYHIKSDPSKTEIEAKISFLEDYEKQGPYKEGPIFWRRLPELTKWNDFAYSYPLWVIEARFIIQNY